MPCRSMNSWAKTLDDSNRAADWFGPQIRKPSRRKVSTTPSANGLSGPTTVRSGRSRFPNSNSPAKSSAPRLTHSTSRPFPARRSRAIPALPGAHQSRDTRADWASFQTKACSRPPPPITSSFIGRDSIRSSAGIENKFQRSRSSTCRVPGERLRQLVQVLQHPIGRGQIPDPVGGECCSGSGSGDDRPGTPG